MKENVGGFDGAVRVLLFIIALSVSIMTGQWWWSIIGIIFFATAVVSKCPIYRIFGIDTNKTKKVSH